MQNSFSNDSKYRMNKSVAIVDDHVLMARALSGLIEKFENYDVLFDVSGGRELITKIQQGLIPDIVLLDINMPEMDGFEVCLWLKNNHPQINVLALSMNDKDESVVKMIKSGAKGYLLKGCKPSELKVALDSISTSGFHYTEYLTSQLIRNLNQGTGPFQNDLMKFNERELAFIRWSCSDFTYVEIADKMCVSARTVDGYRESVFAKMNVKSRVGMVLIAIKEKIVEL